MTTREGLGIDIGGVIIARVGRDSDTSFFSEKYLDTPAMPGAFEVIRRLVDERFGSRVFLVSKCGPKTRAKTLRWLKHHRFFERTGVKPKHLRFCVERIEKGPICRKLGITHFVDDHLDVLLNLKTVPYRFLFDLAIDRSNTKPRALGAIMTVNCWSEIADAVLPAGSRWPSKASSK